MPPSRGRLAALVGAGIMVTRVLGFVRERVFAQYLGDSAAAGAFRAALRIPNVIRNLLGEGTLAASFIPVYAGMVERGETDDARRLAAVIASLLVLVTAAATLLGIVLAPVITDFAAPGFEGDTRTLTIRLVEIMFPMSGIMILSGWCLGILNTHRRFFLSYAAPAVWNVAQIAVLVGLGAVLVDGSRLVVALAWGALAGSVLQVLVQLPTTLRLAGRIRWSLQRAAPGVRRVIRNWLPVMFGAGVYQVSGLIENQLASLLGPEAVAILGYAQLVALLPVSLFGISVAAVALPELSRDAVGAGTEKLRRHIAEGARRVAFFVLPSAFAFATLGNEIIAALFQTGAFGAAETVFAGGVLAAYAVGVPAQASVKLLASGHYALGDTKTPVRIAAVSVTLSAALALLLMGRFGAPGIALGASLGAYVNLSLNFGLLSRRLGGILGRPEHRAIGVTLGAAALAALTAARAAALLEGGGTWLTALATLAAFGAVFGAVTFAAGHPDARGLARRLVGRGQGAGGGPAGTR